jgi:thiamine-phosphate pyrophosphorylase
MISLPRLYAIADASFGNPIELAGGLFDGGARLVQIRNKKAGARELLDQVEAVLQFAPSDALVLVNDRVDVALLANARGVHLGQDDLPPEHAREVLGEHSVIGLSTHSLDQALRADRLPIDYIAVGPIYPTATKVNPDAAVGVIRLSEICRKVSKPVVAIGGITLDRASDVLRAGAASIAVIRDLLAAGKIVERTHQWITYTQ